MTQINFEQTLGEYPPQPRDKVLTTKEVEALNSPEAFTSVIMANNVDELVLNGIDHIVKTGERIDVNAGQGLQSYGVNYVLTDSRKRIHGLRAPESVQYFAREMIAYFNGSLNVGDGLSLASNFWTKLADDEGNINSNYGHYVFHKPLDGSNGELFNQYDWVIANLDRNLQSRKAIANINQPIHKKDTKDFPCTIAMQYFTRINIDGDLILCSEVASRSTDIITGLPYDMGFFSFLTELVYADLVQRGHSQLRLGYTMMKPTFTQIYDRTADKAGEMLNRDAATISMPPITDASETLKDIYNGTNNSNVLQWIYENANL